ncbi:hypothetical protein A2U01_0048638, partial [Trifolium medium]|nr:hypothetical protein [Trifolium medium]
FQTIREDSNPTPNSQDRRDKSQPDIERPANLNRFGNHQRLKKSPANLNKFGNSQRIKYHRKPISQGINHTPAAPDPTPPHQHLSTSHVSKSTKIAKTFIVM